MPYDPDDFSQSMAAAYARYTTQKKKAGDLVDLVQQYFERELSRVGIPQPNYNIKPYGKPPVPVNFTPHHGWYVLGGYYAKEVDFVVESNHAGPLLGISFKSMMSSIRQNVNNRVEEAVGDAANLHARFPKLVLGYVMVLPYVGEKLVGGKAEYVVHPTNGPTELARAISRKLGSFANRLAPTDSESAYEEVAVCVVDFSASRPVLHPTFPPATSQLRLEDFFDRLAARYKERVPFP